MVLREARRYALAVVAVAAAVVIARALDPWISPHISGPYFLAVMVAAAYAGAGPGLLATLLSSFAIAWFDLGSTGNLDLGFDDLLRLAVFTAEAIIISSISAARKAAERELRQALDELAALDRSKDEFIATVSHELRTPLTSILGWLKILQVKDLDEETRKLALDSIEQSARTQAMLVSDMLDASRIVLGKLHVEREPLFVRDVVRDAVAVISPAAEAKKMTIDGLSIVRHIVELHGGSVSAYSAGRNHGATFTARLPLLRDAEQRRHMRPLPEEPSLGVPRPPVQPTLIDG